MGPPLGTLVFKYPTDLDKDATIGIDTQFLSAQVFLKGIKRVPPGLHLFHFSRSVEKGDSMRYGWWFRIEEGQIFAIEWDEDRAVFELILPDDAFAAAYPLMIDYPESYSKWQKLIKFVDDEALEEHNPTPPEPISSGTPLVEENMVLLDVLKLKQPTLQLENQQNNELRYTIIEEKRQEPNVAGEELTRSALDRSWLFRDLFGHDRELFFAEMQLCFIHFLILGNLCSCTQWTTLMLFVLRCESFLRSDSGFCAELLTLLAGQFSILPPDYIDELLVMHIVDTGKVKSAMRNFAVVFLLDTRLLSLWLQVRETVSKFSALGLAPNFDQDNFEVYEISQHHDGDEDAPAIVYS